MKLPPIYLCLLSAPLALVAQSPTLDLAGTWEVSLVDPASAPARWQPIRLPGTLDDAGIGEPLALEPELTLPVLTRLQRKVTHVGPAWYRCTVEIPADWKGRTIVLELERVLWESRVFIDGRQISRADSLTTPHRHDLTALLRPGSRHEIVLRIDNREIHPDLSLHGRAYVGALDGPMAHAYTNHTQIMWNGVLGRIGLRAEKPDSLRALHVTPRLTPRPALTLRTAVAPRSASDRACRLVLRRAGSAEVVAGRDAVFDADGRLEWELPLDVAITPWDEFSPALYELVATQGEGAEVRTLEATFGFREVAARGRELQLNGRRLFLRGNLECAIFPLTGQPPTDLDAWKRLFSTAKEWGLNHLRFHSWCPPGAAFTAADQLGLYLQVELPNWTLGIGRNETTWRFLQAEGERILAAYGNHPSFLFFSLGNELQGDMRLLEDEVRRLRALDPSRLYTATTFTFERGHGRAPEPADDFFITQYTKAGWIRGQGVFNERPPAFDGDYAAASAGIDVPLVAHEIGQYSVFPDMSEIARYTGNLVPLNFLAVRDALTRRGLLELAPRFTAASGRFAALLYKEEIERALRTAEFDGFQLLQLQDFPGQGTALVGLLNAFWEPKGFITAAEFREFCAPVVPLARFPKAVYERGETFTAQVEIANFLRDLPAATIDWLVRDERGAVVARGRLPSRHLAYGGNTRAGAITVPIPPRGPAARWGLEVALAGTPYRNRWKIWIYPNASEVVLDAPGVTFTGDLAEAQAALAAGGTVLFAPPPERLGGIPGKFVPVFWSPVHFPDQPGTMGLLPDPDHPALAAFPTDEHSDWQWWDLVLRSKSLVIDDLPVAPIVRVIDNFNRNHALANVVEARVGPGRLLISAIDLSSELEKRPAARQLRASLIAYAASPVFRPADELTSAQLDRLAAPPP